MNQISNKMLNESVAIYDDINNTNDNPINYFNCVNENVINDVNKYNNFYIIENDFNPIIEIYSRNKNRDSDIFLELIVFMNMV